jgi:histone-lysine N-methyltransferase SETMAR
VVRFLHDENLPANSIHQHLVELFGEKVMAYSTITRTLREMRWTGPGIQNGRLPNFSIDATILRVLNRDPIASIREIVRKARLPASTTYYVLTTRMGCNYRRYRLVPHNLSAQQRNDRLKQNRELLEVLQNAKRLRWRFIRTKDESWFFYVNRHQKLWRVPNSDAPEVACRRINAPKMMVTLFWNASGFQVSDFLGGESFDADYFVRNALAPIHHLQIVDVAQRQKKRFILLIENSPIHMSTVIRAKLSQMPVHPVVHPPYSPGLAPSDCFLFGYLKTKMPGPEFDSPELYLTGSRPSVREYSAKFLREFLRTESLMSRNTPNTKVILFLKTK